MTATGRVIGDAHWFSDTLAAGFFALAAASALSKLSDVMTASSSKVDEVRGFHEKSVANLLGTLRAQKVIAASGNNPGSGK